MTAFLEEEACVNCDSTQAGFVPQQASHMPQLVIVPVMNLSNKYLLITLEANKFVIVAVPTTVKVDKSHFRECLLETLTEMFGQECVNPLIKGDKMTMTVEGKEVYIDLSVLVGVSSSSPMSQ